MRTKIFVLAFMLFSISTHAQVAVSTKIVNSKEHVSLNKAFFNYHLFSVNTTELLGEITGVNKSSVKIQMSLPEIGWVNFVLNDANILAKDYKVFVNGIKKAEPALCKVYSGTIEGDINSAVRLTIADGVMYGMFSKDGIVYFMEPLNYLAKGELHDVFVFYRTTDVRPNSELTCGVTETNEKKGVQQPEAGVTCKQAEIAIASDASIFSKYGSANAVEVHNIGVMNNVLWNYVNAQLTNNLEFIIVGQYVSTQEANDPLTPAYSGTNSGTILSNFRAWGNNDNFNLTYDLAQLWTNRNIDEDGAGGGSSVIGLAYVGTVCGPSRYHILEDYAGTIPSGSGYQLRVLTAHEIGHNFSASHDAPGSGFIMAPSINNTTTWSPASITSIDNHINSRICLSNCAVAGAPLANFILMPEVVCPGTTVQITDRTLNGPDTWSWTFTGGSPSVSSDRNPSVTYSTTGLYNAHLSASNSAGTGSKTKQILVSPSATVACSNDNTSPTSSAGIKSFSFQGINNITGGADTDGHTYMDFSCSQVTGLAPATTYSGSVQVGTSSPSNQFNLVQIFIDYNNDGDFNDPDEFVYGSGSCYIGTVNFSFTTPASVPVTNQILRMRVMAKDCVGGTNACYNVTNGQVEDYGVVFLAPYSISTTVNTSDICAGASIQVDYTANGAFLGNTFTAQLSDASGSFSNPVVIGDVLSDISGTISAVVPQNTSAGTGYRIRVVSSNPVIIGDDNGADITVSTPTAWYQDADADGYGNPAVSVQSCSQPVGYVADNTDCDDNNTNVHQEYAFYADADGDGYGAGSSVMVCAVDANTPPAGYSTNNTDCDDNDTNVHQEYAFYADADGDGYGAGSSVMVCAVDANTPPAGYSTNNTDCDDNDTNVHQEYAFYADADGDGYGAGLSVLVCAVDANTPPAGYSTNNTDCDDNNTNVHQEYAFYTDADGDGYGAGSSVMVCAVDANTPPAGYSTNNTDCDDNDTNVHQEYAFYADADGDGYGAGSSVMVCAVDANTPPAGYSTNNTDCDDNNTNVHQEYAFYTDADGDGYGAGSSVLVCAVDANTPPAGYSTNNTDCDDNDNTIYPGAYDIPGDGIDQDCDGEDAGGQGTVWYQDADGDGFGNPVVFIISQTAPLGYVADNTDCDDSDNTVYPGAPELCDGKDNDCNGFVDDVPMLDAPEISGQVNVCTLIGNNISSTYIVDPIAGATGYQWTLPPNVTVVSGMGTNQLTVTFDAGFAMQNNKQLRVVAKNACVTSAMSIFYLNAQYPGTLGNINGPTDACDYVDGLTQVVYTVPQANQAEGYNWTVPNGMNIVSGQGTNSIAVTFDAGFSAGVISVYAENSCGISNVRSLTIGRMVPGTPGPINGPNNPCVYMPSVAHPQGLVATYRVPAVSGFSYTWLLPSGAILSNQYADNGEDVAEVLFGASYSGGNIGVKASTGCGESAVRNFTLLERMPAAPSGIDVQIVEQDCPNRIFNYSLSRMPMQSTSVEWTVPAGGTIISGQGTANITVEYSGMAISGNVTATANNGCGNSAIRSIMVKLPECHQAARELSVTKFSDESGLYFDVFPNPSAGSFNIRTGSLDKIGKMQISVLDNLGRIYKIYEIIPGETLLLGDELKAGTYFIMITQGKQKATRRIVKL